MLIGQKHSIRQTMKDGGEQENEYLRKMLEVSVLAIANIYTGAKFDNPISQEQQMTLSACTDFIIEMFPMLGLKEIELAFKLASAGKFEGVNLETYYGKFTVQFLGKVLNSYLTHRKKVLGVYSEQEQLERNRQVKENLDAQNKDTHLHVLEEYKNLQAEWLKNGDIESIEKLATPYWAKILIKHEIINFTAEQKKEIWEEAKDLVHKELSKELNFGHDQTPANRRNLVASLRRIANDEQDSSYELKARNKYSKLIIIKSIINQ